MLRLTDNVPSKRVKLSEVKFDNGSLGFDDRAARFLGEVMPDR
jgi:hypothetical protein